MAKAEPDVETIEQIAERLLRDLLKRHSTWLGDEFLADGSAKIGSALKARDERAVRIVEDAWRRLDALNAEAAEPMRAVLDAIREAKE